MSSGDSLDLSKLNSFDQDVRFMGLNDLAAAVTQGTAPVDRSVIKAVATCMADTSADVQNEAIKVMAMLSETGELTELVIIDTVNQKAPVAARGIALKQIFQRGVITAHTLGVVVELLENPVFQSVEGIDALIELLARAPSIPNDAADKLTQRLLHILIAKSSQLSVALPIIEALAITIPHISEHMWHEEVRPLIVAKNDDPLYLGLIGKLAGYCPDKWLVPDLVDSVLHHLDPPLDSINHNVAEAAIKAASALVNKLPASISEDQASGIAQKALVYREFDASDSDHDDADADADADANADADNGGDQDDCMYVDDDDEDWYDESSAIRQAGCQLAVALGDARSVSDALNSEHDEATRVAMYNALGSLVSPASNDIYTENIERQIAKDIKRKRMVAADAGIKVVAEHRGYVNSSIILNMIRASKLSSHKYILLLRAQPNERDIVKAILLPLFKEYSASEEVLLHAVEQAASTKLVEFYEPIWSLLQRSGATKLRAKCLESLPVFGAKPDQTLDAELQALQGALHDETVAALTAISILNLSGQISDYSRVITEVARVLSGGDCTELCCEVLCAFPADYAESVAEALAGGGPSAPIESSFSASPHLLAQPAALKWAVSHSSENLVHKIAALPNKYESVVSYCLESTDSPLVIAAAVSADPQNWAKLTTHYKFDTTPFAQLGNRELVALKSLATWGCRWEWYSFEDMAQDITSDLQSEVLGSITAITSGKATEDAERFSSLAKPFNTRAFVAYTKQLRDPSTAIQVMHDFPQLQSAEAAAAAVLSERMLEVFLANFGETSPDLVIETMKLVTRVPNPLVLAWEPLAQYVLNTNLSGKTRSDALATLRWMVQSASASTTKTLELATDVLEPDASQVQVVNIGPFKHKVDSTAVLRHTALETILAWLPDSTGNESDIMTKCIEAVVQNSLDDPEHEIKMVAFRLIGILADLKILALKPLVPTIEAKINEKLAQKLKETAVKQDVEKYTDLSRVMTDTLRKIHSSGLTA